MAHPASSLSLRETLSSGAEPLSTRAAGEGAGGGDPMGDVLSWDTHLHVLAVHSPVTLNKSPANGLVPPFPVCKGEMEQRVWRSLGCHEYLWVGGLSRFTPNWPR